MNDVDNIIEEIDIHRLWLSYHIRIESFELAIEDLGDLLDLIKIKIKIMHCEF